MDASVSSSQPLRAAARGRLARQEAKQREQSVLKVQAYARGRHVRRSNATTRAKQAEMRWAAGVEEAPTRVVVPPASLFPPSKPAAHVLVLLLERGIPGLQSRGPCTRVATTSVSS